MNDATPWWLLAGLLVAVELGTGSFYLLMLALGAACGALAAHLGLGSSLQIVVAGVAGAAATFAWYRHRKAQARDGVPVEANRDVNLDVGETVQVQSWDAQGMTQVSYRGASWQARHVGSEPPQAGPHRIVALRGNTLELSR